MNRACGFCGFADGVKSLQHSVFHTIWQMRESAKCDYPASALADAIEKWAANLEGSLRVDSGSVSAQGLATGPMSPAQKSNSQNEHSSLEGRITPSVERIASELHSVIIGSDFGLIEKLILAVRAEAQGRIDQEKE